MNILCIGILDFWLSDYLRMFYVSVIITYYIHSFILKCIIVASITLPWLVYHRKCNYCAKSRKYSCKKDFCTAWKLHCLWQNHTSKKKKREEIWHQGYLNSKDKMGPEPFWSPLLFIITIILRWLRYKLIWIRSTLCFTK